MSDLPPAIKLSYILHMSIVSIFPSRAIIFSCPVVEVGIAESTLRGYGCQLHYWTETQ